MKLRAKINEMLTIEAENKYISKNNEAEIAFSPHVGYIQEERGRNFSSTPSVEYQKTALLNIINRNNHSTNNMNKIHTQRVDPRVTQLMEVMFRNPVYQVRVHRERNSERDWDIIEGLLDQERCGACACGRVH